MANNTLDEIRGRLRRLEAELSAELERVVERNREQFRYTIRAGKIRFEEGVQALHTSYRTGLIAYLRNAPVSYLLSAPLIYSLLILFLLIDLWVTVFQQVCFRIYGIDRVRRADYILFDRHLLGYLNAAEKLNCLYCSYVNNLIAYLREIAARTEQFWCPIKHARRATDEHERQQSFFEYGDAIAYRADLPKIRAKLVD
jgi:hypothetical protein